MNVLVVDVGGTHVKILATGESVAHVNHLLQRGDAVVDRVEHGAGWYRLP